MYPPGGQPTAEVTVKAAQVRAELARRYDVDGYVVLGRAVAAPAIEAVLRLLNLSIRHRGLSPEEIGTCQETTFFPHLRWEPQVWDVLPSSAADLLGYSPGDEWAEPQLLLRFPDEAQTWPLQSHVDQPPPWAGGREYRGIVGVAITTTGAQDGAPCVWPCSHRGSPHAETLVPLEAGDALVMHPALAHSGTLNLGSRIRVAIYFRLIAAAGPAG